MLEAGQKLTGLKRSAMEDHLIPHGELFNDNFDQKIEYYHPCDHNKRSLRPLKCMEVEVASLSDHNPRTNTGPSYECMWHSDKERCQLSPGYRRRFEASLQWVPEDPEDMKEWKDMIPEEFIGENVSC